MLIGGRVEAGSIFIVVPARCVFTVDRRINPEEDVEREHQALFDVFAASRRDGVSVDVDVLQVARPSGIMASTPVSKTASASWPRCGLTGSPWSSVKKEAQIAASITQASSRFTTRESAVAGALCDLGCGSGLPVDGIVHCERNTLPLPESSDLGP